jgi:magnesium chelatase family protein
MNNYAIALGMYLIGLAARVVCVKATATNGEFEIVSTEKPKPGSGRIDKWRETRVRVACALRSIGVDTNFTITFDHEPPRTPGLDLAIFAACLGAVGRLPSDYFNNHSFMGCKIFIGELSLQGEVRPTRGVLPMIAAYTRCDVNSDIDERQFVVPYDCAVESSYIDKGTSTYAVKHVSELFNLSAHTIAIRREYRPIEPTGTDLVRQYNENLLRLPARVVRAIEIAVAGNHSIHLIGSNAFKAAKLLHALLPPMPQNEAVETASLHSIAGLLRNEPNQIGMRSFRAPHHTISEIGLVGGGDPIRPGEVSLAHNGVLYLDSLPEFKRGAIEILSGALRQGMVHICRRTASASFLAKPLLVTGCRRCPCEFRNGKHSDYCTPERRKEWQSRHVDTLGIEMMVDTDFADGDKACAGDLETLRRWIACAREFGQREDLDEEMAFFDMNSDVADLEQTGPTIARIARTIANLETSQHTRMKHLDEAALYVAR